MDRVFVVSYFGSVQGVFASQADADGYITSSNDGEEFEPGDWEVEDFVIGEGVN